jgi:muconolactone delta-isomerase
MQFLGIAKPKAELFARGLPSDFQDLVLQEQEKARSIYADGVLRQIWQRDDGNGAVALFEAHSMEHMLTILSTFPLVRAGYLDYELIPLRAYGGFAPAS